jgi:hypothetical protein
LSSAALALSGRLSKPHCDRAPAAEFRKFRLDAPPYLGFTGTLAAISVG